MRELVGFERVMLEPGAVATVTFELRPTILAYYDLDMNLVMTPGDVHLMAGPSSVDAAAHDRLTITGEPTTLTSRTVHLTPSTID